MYYVHASSNQSASPLLFWHSPFMQDELSHHRSSVIQTYPVLLPRIAFLAPVSSFSHTTQRHLSPGRGIIGRCIRHWTRAATACVTLTPPPVRSKLKDSTINGLASYLRHTELFQKPRRILLQCPPFPYAAQRACLCLLQDNLPPTPLFPAALKASAA